MRLAKFKRPAQIAVALLFWIAVWEIGARLVDLEFIFPRVGSTLRALILLIGKKKFWTSMLLSLFRIVYGFILGVLIGTIASFLCNVSHFARSVITPAIAVVRSTPVASAIMLVWFIIGSEAVPATIAVLMVAPIICQNLLDGYAAIDRDLEEVCDVFRVPYLKRLKILVIPTLVRFLLPALVSASALAWKSGVAAEIITYTDKSLGRLIIDAKSSFDGAEMFALTLVVILISVAIEALIKRIVRAVMK